MARNNIDFETWAEQNPNLSQDLGIRPPRNVSELARINERADRAFVQHARREPRRLPRNKIPPHRRREFEEYLLG